MEVNGFPDREIQVGSKSFLYFGGTSYLGLSTHPEFQNNLVKGIKKWGTSYGSSRNANIKLSIFHEAERIFAQKIGAEASLTFSSGTLAGTLVLECLSKPEHTFYHYPKTHPAILHKNSLPVFIDGKLHPNLLTNTIETIVITADAFLGLEVTPTSFEFLHAIAPQKQIILVIDESHSLGLVGHDLKGVGNTISFTGLHQKIMVSSLGKALGLSGGIVAANQHFIDTLKQHPSFVSSSSISPAYLQAFLDSESIIKSQQQQLVLNLKFLFEGLHLKSSFKSHEKYPVIYCHDEAIFNYLYRRGIIITNFKYPTYSKAMNRIVITANHTQNDLQILKQALMDFSNCI